MSSFKTFDSLYSLRSTYRESSKIVKAMIKWRKDNGQTNIRPSSCVRLLYDWVS